MNWEQRRKNDRNKRLAREALNYGSSAIDETIKTAELLGVLQGGHKDNKEFKDLKPWAQHAIKAARFSDYVRNMPESSFDLPVIGNTFSHDLKYYSKKGIDKVIKDGVPMFVETVMGELGKGPQTNGVDVQELLSTLHNIRTVRKNLPPGVKKDIEAAVMRGLSRAFMNPVADAGEALYKVPLEIVKGLGRWITGKKLERPLSESDRKFAENAFEYALATGKIPSSVKMDKRQKKAAMDYAVKRWYDLDYDIKNGKIVYKTENKHSAKRPSVSGQRIDIGVEAIGDKNKFNHGPVSVAEDIGLNSVQDRLQQAFRSPENIQLAGNEFRNFLKKNHFDEKSRDYFNKKRQSRNKSAIGKDNGKSPVKASLDDTLRQRGIVLA